MKVIVKFNKNFGSTPHLSFFCVSNELRRRSGETENYSHLSFCRSFLIKDLLRDFVWPGKLRNWGRTCSMPNYAYSFQRKFPRNRSVELRR